MEPRSPSRCRTKEEANEAADSPDVLLVEDNPDDVELTLRALKRAHVANPVRVVRDGAEALEFLFGGEPRPALPRVVLLDLKLPRVNGLEVLERIRREESTRTLPVVVLTSSREEPDVQARLRARSQQLHRQAGRVREVRRGGGRGRSLLARPQPAARVRRR